ncbi:MULTISPECIES: competence protein ComK [Bacillus]|uniref:competence protein ComK n=1 Tax=Bacillus TaxID=1386 RepID=UPI00030109E7|nr:MULTISPECIES: competence protein ComK [Bacillus]
MSSSESYCLSKDTISIIPYTDNHGNLYSMVIEGQKKLLVKMSPLKILEYTLLIFGGDLRGAINSTKFHLGRKNMVPVKISDEIGYWFPTSSMKSRECVWFAEHHVEKVNKVSQNQTMIYFSHGHTFLLNMKEKSIAVKINRARDLRLIIERKKKKTNIYTEQPKFQIIKDESKNNYTIKEDK